MLLSPLPFYSMQFFDSHSDTTEDWFQTFRCFSESVCAHALHRNRLILNSFFGQMRAKNCNAIAAPHTMHSCIHVMLLCPYKFFWGCASAGALCARCIFDAPVRWYLKPGINMFNVNVCVPHTNSRTHSLTHNRVGLCHCMWIKNMTQEANECSDNNNNELCMLPTIHA